jgi:hypothetical protein
MECEKVRDRFSSLLEGELNPLEEKAVREHLASCLECKKDYEGFEKTIGWLHSLKDVEAPEGFLSGVFKKMEERKKMGSRSEDDRPGWFHTLAQLRLPVQAVAMVAIVFVALYLTKMMPVEKPTLKDVEQTTTFGAGRKMEAKLVQKETEKEKEAKKLLSEAPKEKRMGEGLVLEAKEETRSPTPYPPKAKASAVEAGHIKEADKAEVPSREAGKAKKDVMSKGVAFLAGKPPQEIVLRVSDRDKALSQLEELVKKFGGELVKKEEANILFASLPTASFAEFKKELEGMSPSKKAEQAAPQKEYTEGMKTSSGVKPKEVVRERKEPASSGVDKESRITVRILLVQE